MENVKLKYKIALINYLYPQNGDNALLFESVAEQTTFFNNQTRGLWSPLVNFNMGDNIFTSVFVKDTSGRTPEVLCRCNYAVIKKVEVINDTETEIERRYFFAKCSQDSATQMFVRLELDDIQTNYIYKNLRGILSGSFKRSHLNRFDYVGNGKVKFTDNECIYDNEDIILPKILKTRNQLKIKYNNDTDLSNWLDTYVNYWVYIFVDPNHNYEIGGENNTFVNVDGKNFKYNIYNQSGYSFESEVGVLFYPVMKSGHIVIRMPNNQLLNMSSDDGEKLFRNKNNNVSYYISKKASIVNYLTFLDYDIEDNVLYINGGLFESDNTISINGNERAISCDLMNNLDNRGLFIGGINTINFESDFQLSDNFEFNISDIIENLKLADETLEPKLLSTSCKDLRLSSLSGETSEYNIQKINNKNVTVLYNEPLCEDVTRYYMRLKPSGLYKNGTDKNYLGVNGTTDNSLAVMNDQYANFIAQNKNFYLQSASQIAITGALGLLSSLFIGNPLGVVGALVGAGAQGINKASEIDNLKNAPGMKSGANGSWLFNTSINSPRLYYEIYEALSCEKTSFFNYLQKYGYKFSENGYLKDFDRTRSWYNYIQVDLNDLNLNFISNEEFRRLKDLFSRGVRFWHYDRFSGSSAWAYSMELYKYENYERNLLTYLNNEQTEEENDNGNI